MTRPKRWHLFALPAVCAAGVSLWLGKTTAQSTITAQPGESGGAALPMAYR